VILDPSLAVHGAVYAAMTAAGGPGPTYDNVPPGAACPYFTIDPFDVLPDAADGYDGNYVVATVSSWSRAMGKVEVETMNSFAVQALCTELDASAHGVRVVTWEFVRAHVLDDPDGVTKHGVVQVKYGVEPLA
jgi:hypothetical protein